jgi:hypothetical protein
MRFRKFHYEQTKRMSSRQQDFQIMCKDQTVSSLGTPAVRTLAP